MMAFIEKNIEKNIPISFLGSREDVVVSSTDTDRFSASVHSPRDGESRKASPYRSFFKRGFDVLLVFLAAPLWLPLVLLGAVLVMLDGHSPFYTQERVGRNGRTFHIWKLRSMVPNAEACLESYLAANPEARIEWGRTQKLLNDPRVTVVGRILRKTSLDELPQFFNVLRGDMSVVGPRPIMVSQKPIYFGRHYYYMRPGVTGLWQVTDRNECSFAERVHFDDSYYRTMSFWTDSAILVRTLGVVLRGTGY